MWREAANDKFIKIIFSAIIEMTPIWNYIQLSTFILAVVLIIHSSHAQPHLTF